MRKEYEMSEDQEKEILNACKSVPYIIVGGRPPRSPQENANATWCALGKKMGFDGMTVQPISGKGTRFFTAESTGVTELEGKPVPEYKPNGTEWHAAMMDLDKEAIVAILKTKCEEVDAILKNALEGVPDQGLQIQSRMMDGIKWGLYSDAEKFHDQLQTAHGRNFTLAAEIMDLKKQIEIHVNCEKELREGLAKACGQRDAARVVLRSIKDSFWTDGEAYEDRVRDLQDMATEATT